MPPAETIFSIFLPRLFVKFHIRREVRFTVDTKSSARVGEILPRVLELLGLDSRFEEVKLMRGWAEVVGPVIAQKSRPRMLKDGILFIEVENSVWMQELWFHQKQIIERIKKEYPKVEVKGVRLEIERENR
jgi:hypothetical protein